MRCALGKKKLAFYSKKFGLPFTKGLVRGNTNHRVDLCTGNNEAYQWYCYFPNADKLYLEDKKGDLSPLPRLHQQAFLSSLEYH